jgi:hypothetical protein
MGEKTKPLFVPEFNRSIHIEARPERLTADAGALIVRETMDRLGLIAWLAERLKDPRNPELITHPLEELLRTEILLHAQGWRDQDDADHLRNDPALRLGVSNRRGIGPLEQRDGDDLGKNPPVPDGLPSQPTLSRLDRALSSAENLDVLRRALLESAARRVLAMNGGHRPRYITIDVDSFPVDVHGHQPGSEYNGHYHGRIYHPLIASSAELGDILDMHLRPGNVHTAEGSLEFVLPLIDRVETKLCQVASVRIDAGFPEEKLLSALEQRGVAYVARVKNNKVLDSMAEPQLRRPVGRRPKEPRTFFHEFAYQAGSWSRARRVVLVVLEREDDLFLHHFWLITNWPPDQKPPEQLLELYRQRGTAEGHFGEFMDMFDPALSSSPRPKTKYRGKTPAKRYPSGDSFRINEVQLLLNAIGYNVAHAVRVLYERATGEGVSLRRVRERMLRVAARVLLHSGRAVVVLGLATAELWAKLWTQLEAFRPIT